MSYMKNRQGRRIDWQRAPLHVFIGESNSGGIGLNTDLTAGELAVRPSVKIWDNVNNDGFDDLDIGTNNLLAHTGLSATTDPLGGGTYSVTRHGWEAGLANSAEAGDWNTQVYLAKCGQGGSNLAQWSNPNASGYWATFLTRFRGAVAAMRAQRIEPDVYIWASIGINDDILGTTAASFKTLLLDWIARIRTEVQTTTGIAHAPITFTELPPNRATYNAKLVEVADADPLLFLVDSTGASLQSDGNHWTAAGLKYEAAEMVLAHRESVGQGAQYDASTAAPGFAGGARVSALEAEVARLSQIIDSAYSLQYVPVTWASMSAGVTDAGGGQINGSGSANVGGMRTDPLDADNFSLIVDMDANAATNGVVVLLDDDNTASFSWNSGQVFKGCVYHINGTFFHATTGTNAATTSVTTSFASKVRLSNSGDDLVVEKSTDGGNSWAPVYTYAGALAGLTYVYLKVIFATAAASQHVKVSHQEVVVL